MHTSWYAFKTQKYDHQNDLSVSFYYWTCSVLVGCWNIFNICERTSIFKQDIWTFSYGTRTHTHTHARKRQWWCQLKSFKAQMHTKSWESGGMHDSGTSGSGVMTPKHELLLWCTLPHHHQTISVPVFFFFSLNLTEAEDNCASTHTWQEIGNSSSKKKKAECTRARK